GSELPCATQVLAPETVPHPCATLTFARLRSAPTPLLSLSTIVSFHAMVLGRSRIGGSRRRMPSEPPSAACCIASNLPATWISAFEGMQPRIKQGPPSRSLSTSVASEPACPALIPAP